MVQVHISKNNGFLEYKEVDIDIAMIEQELVQSHATMPTWEVVKLQWAKAIYTEEDLLSIEGPHEIKLYRMPQGDDVDSLPTEAIINVITQPKSTWVLDIFGRALMNTADLTALSIDGLVIEGYETFSLLFLDLYIKGNIMWL